MQNRIPESKEVQEHRKAQEREADLRILEGRVRRALKKSCIFLTKSRGKKQSRLFGRYCLRDKFGIMPIQHHVDLPGLAQRLHIYFDDLKVR